MPLSAENLAADARALLADFPQAATISRPGRTAYSAPAAVDFSGGGQALADDGAARWSTAYASATLVAADRPWRPRVGDRVRHVKFGTGQVLSIKDRGRDYEVTVDFPAWGTKKMFAGFAKLVPEGE